MAKTTDGTALDLDAIRKGLRCSRALLKSRPDKVPFVVALIDVGDTLLVEVERLQGENRKLRSDIEWQKPLKPGW